MPPSCCRDTPVSFALTPLRLVLCSYNLWNVERWPEREPALRGFLQRFTPDLLAVQELRAETRDCIDATLPAHARVHDDFPGWSRESNLWWHDGLLERAQHGAEEYGSHESTRRLFWVRLRRRDNGRTLLAATVHLTPDFPDDERGRAQALRLQQTRAIVEALDTIRGPDEPTWLLGDLNEAVQPGRLLHRAGLRSCFSALGLQPPPTFPAVPTAGKAPDDYRYNACYDWILARGPVRPLAAHSPHFFHGDIAPSDHWPVVAVYDWAS